MSAGLDKATTGNNIVQTMPTDMNGALVNNEPAARLPSVEVVPVPTNQLEELAASWRGVGLWLTVWDMRGRMIWYDRQGSRLWTTLLARSSHVRDYLRRSARSALDGREAPPDAPWGRSLRLTPVPTMQRRRMTGVVLAASVRGEADEDFIRLCDRSRLDATLMGSLLKQAARHDDRMAEGLRELLTHALRQAMAVDAGTKQAESFTKNLEDTYEELSLVYGVTGMLSMTDNPDQAIAHVAEEALTVSKTAGIVLLLPSPPEDLPATASAFPRNSIRVLRIGQLHAEPTHCRQMGELMNVVPADRGAEPLTRSMPGYVLKNRLTLEPGWRWAREWLEHAVALPLVHKDRWLGVMIAVNRTDGGDFSSVAVKFLRAIADRITSFLETRRLYDDLADLLMGLLHAMVSSIDAKDPYTCGHSERVAAMSRLLAQKAGVGPAECQRVYLAGLLHDVGKIGVPDAILCKPGKLTEDEFRVLRRHPQIGARILGRITQVADLLPGVLYHHERIDGRGYPEGRAGEDIPLLGRLICLADCFDAMTTNRTYRSALPVEAALAEIRRCSGTQFDPYLAERFLSIDLPQFLAESSAAAEAAQVAATPATYTILSADPSEVSAALQAVLPTPWKLPRNCDS